MTPWPGVVEWRGVSHDVVASSEGVVVSLKRGIRRYSPSLNNGGYVSFGGMMAHRAVALAFGLDVSQDIDHINGNKEDNRISNLRACSRSMNMGNSAGQRRRSQKYKGVTKVGRGFVARIRLNRKDYYLGSYSTPEDAANAYNRAAAVAFGEFSKPNEVQDEQN